MEAFMIIYEVCDMQFILALLCYVLPIEEYST